MNLQRHVLFISAAFLLSSCTDEQLATAFPILDARFSEVPINDDSREALRTYFNKPNPKAFAFSPEKGVNWHAWGSSDAKETAISKCESESGTKCELFAVNNDIVWRDGDTSGSKASGLVGTASTTLADVNLRSGPGNDHPSLAVVPSGTSVETVGRNGNWYAVVMDDGRIGYIYGDYLSSE